MRGLLLDKSVTGDVRIKAAASFKKHCIAAGVAPYFIPAGGAMLTPPYDVEESQVSCAAPANDEPRDGARRNRRNRRNRRMP